MPVLVGADGGIEFSLQGEQGEIKFLKNVFSWEASLSRPSLETTRLNDEYVKRTGGIGSWSGSASFFLDFFASDENESQFSAIIFNQLMEESDDDLKFFIRLILQWSPAAAPCSAFESTMAERAAISGIVVMTGLSLNCEDPEKPLVANLKWESDGSLIFSPPEK